MQCPFEKIGLLKRGHYLDSEATNGLKIEGEVSMIFCFGSVHKISFKSDDGNPVKQQLSKLEFGILQKNLLSCGKKSQKPQMLFLSGLGAK